MDSHGTTLILFLCLFLRFIPTGIAGNEGSVAVNIAAAYNAEINDGWARYIYWQHPDGKIVIQGRDPTQKEPEEIPQTVMPRRQSPLAALYRLSRKDEGQDNVFVSYLDGDGYIIDVACRYQDEEYVDWSTTRTDYRSYSGLAAAEVDGKLRRFYIDDKDFVAEGMDGVATRLGPKAARGSQVAAAVPVGSTDIHVFFVAEDKSLSSRTFNGSEWSANLPAIEEFTSEPKIGFAAVAWSDPWIVRIFHVDQHRLATEWTFEDGSWANTTDTLPKALGALPGEPVAASRSVNGSGRYLEYFYTASGGHINYLARNFVDGPPFQVEFSEFEVPKSEPSLTKDQKIAIGTSIGIGIPTLIITAIGVYIGYKRATRTLEDEGQETTSAKPKRRSFRFGRLYKPSERK